MSLVEKKALRAESMADREGLLGTQSNVHSHRIVVFIRSSLVSGTQASEKLYTNRARDPHSITALAEAPLNVGLQPVENVQEVVSLLRAPEHELREEQVVCGGEQHVDEGQQALLELGGMRLLEPSARAVEVLRAVVQYTRS